MTRLRRDATHQDLVIVERAPGALMLMPAEQYQAGGYAPPFETLSWEGEAHVRRTGNLSQAT